MKQNLPLKKPNNYADTNRPEMINPAPSRGLFSFNQANIFLPLRLFLGISFLAAGVDKLLDPQFFDSTAAGYIGAQLGGFGGQSPIGFMLKSLSNPPIASIVGGVVLVGELAIGLGTLVGLYSRVAALAGFILSVTLWLSASWNVTPFFLGSDLPYAVAWLTLFMAGAHPVLSLDAVLKERETGQPANAAFVDSPLPYAGPANPVTPVWTNDRRGYAAAEAHRHEVARRQFLVITGGIILAGGFTGVAWLKGLHEQFETKSTADTQLTLPPTAAPTTQDSAAATTAAATGAAPATAATGQQTQATSQASAATTAPAAQPKPTAAPAPTAAPVVNGKVIAKLSDIAVGNALAFQTPTTGENAYVVHAKDGSVKAFSRTCTHEGCDVSFIQSAQVFACPCHGAEFDANTGAVLRRPARQPLPSYKVTVDGSGNVIFVM
ncbi:MAG: Rieske 2Fe-2S domain-containing protein [Chloroflexi bacterium]|nr:Rieske 2Fe-2S domain-containing protein [Chloroflexota bacterium]